MSNGKGNGPGARGQSSGNGNSFANGNVTPAWARGWEFQELRASQVSIWTVMP